MTRRGNTSMRDRWNARIGHMSGPLAVPGPRDRLAGDACGDDHLDGLLLGLGALDHTALQPAAPRVGAHGEVDSVELGGRGSGFGHRYTLAYLEVKGKSL